MSGKLYPETEVLLLLLIGRDEEGTLDKSGGGISERLLECVDTC
jgi:hypothetical protein